MGKAYSEQQRAHVKTLLEAGRDEESVEKETGVSDRTVRRWKVELERTGRIGKPPESRTGRHRVLSAEVEAALVQHVKSNPDMSVDDMLWWLYDQYQLVVGTRTIRRVFERKGDKAKPRQGKGARRIADNADDQDNTEQSPAQSAGQYQSPYAPMTQGAEQELARALQSPRPQHAPQQQFSAPPVDLESEMPDDEETLQLQLQQIALQKREVELKLKMRRLQQQGKSTPTNNKPTTSPASQSTPSSLYNPIVATGPIPPKRDSRSKKKIEESKRRTAERQERMLRDLERRSRRRDHLTAEWVQSKDIWPLRAQSLLADLMHQYGCYAYNTAPSTVDAFEAMYRELYQLVDLGSGDWVPPLHDEMLRERMKRKMGQLRAKMQKLGEIVGRDGGGVEVLGYAGGAAVLGVGDWQKAENYTGEQAGHQAPGGDDGEMPMEPVMHAQAGAEQLQDHHQQQQHLQYDALPDHNHHHQAMQHAAMPYGGTAMMQQPNGAPQYPMMPNHHHHQQHHPQHPDLLAYGQLEGGHVHAQHGGLSSHHEGMVM